MDYTRTCFDLAGEAAGPGPKCEGMLVGQAQPYALYVPAKPRPARGWGMTLLLHSLAAELQPVRVPEEPVAARGPGSRRSGRPPPGAGRTSYAGTAEADTFEVWADVARHCPLDADWAVVSGT